MRFFVAIKSAHKHAARRKAQMDTWLPRLRQFAEWYYLIGQPTAPAIPDALMCECDDAFQNIAPKIVAACDYMLQTNSDGMFVMDDDTYAVPERLQAAAVAFYNRGLDYVGFLRTSGLDYNDGKPYAQGSCYYLSARAAGLVLDSAEMKPGIIDDGAVGRALYQKVAFCHDDRFQPGPYPTMDTAPLPSNSIISSHKALPDVMNQLHTPWRKR